MYSALLQQRIAQTECRLCAGFDPDVRRQKIPDASALKKWSFTLIEALHDVVPAFKFQYAYYEAFGPEGLSILKAAIKRSRELGIVTILDAKRSDIESTLLRYVKTAFSSRSGRQFTWDVDAITINPYLSLESLPTILDSPDTTGRGVYLVLTSTAEHKRRLPKSLRLQLDLATKLMAGTAASWISGVESQGGRAFLGFVVSAVEPQTVEYYSRTHQVPLLIPGIGAQGGALATIKHVLARHPLHLFSVSRALYPDGRYCTTESWGREVRKRALGLRRLST